MLTQRRLSDFAPSTRTTGRLLLSVLLVASLCLLYAPVLRDWTRTAWTDPSYSHALIVPAISVYLAYVILRGKDGGAYLVRTDWCGYPILIIGVLLLVAGERAAVTFAVTLSFLVVLGGLILLISGRRLMRALAFPYGFLFFALPLPALVYLPLSFHLQLISSSVAGHALDLLEIPALREGNVITFPNVSLGVVEACSGIHSIFALLAVATLAGYFFFSRLSARLLLALSALPIAVALNSFRITLLGGISYAISPQAGEGLAHESVGVVLFAIASVLVIALAAWFGGLASARHQPPASKAAACTIENEHRFMFHAAAASGLLLITMPAYYRARHASVVEVTRAPLSSFPISLGAWQGRDLTTPQAQLENLRADSVLFREYKRDDSETPVTLFVAYFGAQHEGTAMHSPLHCIPGNGWEEAWRKSLELKASLDDPFLANEILFRQGDERVLVVYWYEQQGVAETSELRGALHTLWDGATNGRTDGCLIRVSTPVVSTSDAALKQQLRFLNDALPLLLNRFLPAPPATSHIPVRTALEGY